MLRGHLTRKIFIASLLYFMLGKYSLILSTFKCCHKKGKVDETRRYNFRLFQVFFLFFSIVFFFFLFSIFNFFFILFSALSCYPKPNITEKMTIDQRSDNKTRLTRYFVRQSLKTCFQKRRKRYPKNLTVISGLMLLNNND